MGQKKKKKKKERKKQRKKRKETIEKKGKVLTTGAYVQEEPY